MSKRKPAAPSQVGDVLSGFLKRRGIAKRVEQASVVTEWPKLVGPQIAAVAEPVSVTADGTLFVAVVTHSWMSELSLLEPDLLKALNSGAGDWRVRKIRFQLKR